MKQIYILGIIMSTTNYCFYIITNQ